MKNIIALLILTVAFMAVNVEAKPPTVGPPFQPYHPRCHNVPDGGSTFFLFGVGLTGLALASYRVKRKA